MPTAPLAIHTLREDPDLWEHLISEENAAARSDAAALARVRSMYWEVDRQSAFNRYYESLDFRQLLDLLRVFKVLKKDPLCEIGGGSGQVIWGLAKEGFKELHLLEPNPRPVTGTGWLRDHLAPFTDTLHICNDLDAWYADPKIYHNVLTRNCVHHFPNIPMVAAAIRQKIKTGGKWVMAREWFADDPGELRQALNDHPYCQKYGVYEFPFPARYYVDSLEYAGFKLIAVVPSGWGGNALSTYVEDRPVVQLGPVDRLWKSIFKKAPWITVALFRCETAINRWFGLKLRRYSRPQILVFKRV